MPTIARARLARPAAAAITQKLRFRGGAPLPGRRSLGGAGGEAGAGYGGLAVGDATVVDGQVARHEYGHAMGLQKLAHSSKEQAVHKHAAGERDRANAFAFADARGKVGRHAGNRFVEGAGE